MRRMRVGHVRSSTLGECASGYTSPFNRKPFPAIGRCLSWLVFALALTNFNAVAADTCSVDTTAPDFNLGTPSNVDVLGGGDVVLASSATVDQQNESLSQNGFTFHHYWWFGQTFKAGTSGPLTAADVRMFCNGCSGTAPDITVSIRAVADNKPTGPDLAVATIPGFLSPTGAYYKATFASPMTMSSGTTYALVVRANAPLSSGEYAYLVSTDDNAYGNGHRLTFTTAGNAWDARDRDIGFRIYTGSGHATSGNLVSALKDSNPGPGGNAVWTNLSWTGNKPPATDLKFHAAASDSPGGPFNFVGPDGTPGSFYTGAGGSLGQFNGKRYLKYKALLSTGNTSVSPMLNDATVCHNVVVESADLSITKTDGVSSAAPGGSVTYTIVAANAGPTPVPNALVTDTFQAPLQNCSWTCAGSGGGGCPASGNGNINLPVNLPPGGNVTFTASCGIAPGASGSLSNTATVGAQVNDPNLANNTATDVDTLSSSADLGITKSDGVSVVTAGAGVSYTIVASNAGPSPVGNATVSDSFPSALQNCSWTCAGSGGGSCPASGSGNINHSVNLPVGASATFTANCTVSGGASGSLANTATIASAVSDPNPGNNSATDTDTIGGSADLSITKTNGRTTSTAGSPVTYTIVASNAGPSNVPNATVNDFFPSELQNCSWTCSGSGGGSCAASGSGNITQSVNLPAGGSATFVASCTLPPAAAGTLTNTANLSSVVPDPNPANNSATDTDSLGGSADLSITNTDGAASATAGNPITYTLVASNAGPSNVTGATVADSFPSSLQNCSWTCSGSGGASCPASGSGNLNAQVNLPANGSVTFLAGCTVKPGATGSLANTATVSSSFSDPVPGNNSATDTNSIVASANLGITKTDGVSSATPGGSVTYTIVASNTGPSNAASATVTDTFPSALQNCSWTCSGNSGGTCPASGSGNINATVGLPAGASTTFTAACQVKASATGSLVNTATVSSTVSDPAPGNNSATDTDTLNPSADLRITKTNGVTATQPGDAVVYTIVASNIGPSNVGSATVADTFSAKLQNCEWMCDASGGATCNAAGVGNISQNVSLPAGGATEFTAVCDVSSTATGTLSNTATVSSAVSDPIPGNNSATDTDALEAVADLEISIDDGTSTSPPGTWVTYQVVAYNAGMSSAPGSTVEVNFPPGGSPVTWTCVASGGATCAASGSGNINDTVNLPMGGSAVYSVSYQVGAQQKAPLHVVGSVSSSVSDPVPDNNFAEDVNSVDIEILFSHGFD